MYKKLKLLKDSEIIEILNQYDEKDQYQQVNIIPDELDLETHLNDHIEPNNISVSSVLGIDIYKYAMYPSLQQTLIPVIFNLMYKETIKFCLKSEEYIFQKYNEVTINRHFISTGDGGFQIFDTPLHCIIFCINFSIILRTFNSFHLYPKLRKLIGEITLRYSITRGQLFHYNKNYFGAAIINNARILSRDTLNRLLIDQNTYEWFMIHLGGIETLQSCNLTDISNIVEFKSYDKEKMSKVNITIHNNRNIQKQIKTVDLLNIGTIKAKGIKLNIYNLHMQAGVSIGDEKNPDKSKNFIISIGNLYTTGI